MCFADAPHGMRRYDVYATLGAPTRILAPDIWAYAGCTTDDPVARVKGYDTMVLMFSRDRLTSKRLVSGAALRAALRAAATKTTSLFFEDLGPLRANSEGVSRRVEGDEG